MNQNIPPAQLWLGSNAVLATHIEQYLQKQLCLVKGCNCCHTCNSIIKRQHSLLLWLTPEKNTYTVNQIEEIRRQLTLLTDKPFFIIIENADQLSRTCANSLLKSLEEPPLNYYFILLAYRPELLLPTITSRCVVKNFSCTTTNIPFLNYFKQLKQPSGSSLIQIGYDIDNSGITEYESRALLDNLLDYWTNQYAQAHITNNPELQRSCERILNILTQSQEQLPMPGSSKYFWRSLYLQLYLISN